MTETALTRLMRPHDVLVTGENKDAKSRLAKFADWLESTGREWINPDLEPYRDALLDRGLAPASVVAHLATIRGRYQKLMVDNAIRDRLYLKVPAQASAADKKAYVDELLIRLQNAIAPGNAPVAITKKQDEPDSAQLRLTRAQANTLLTAPGVDTLKGLRDTAMIALLLCTGIRLSELVALDVDDLRQRLAGELAIFVREGKGAKQRLVPYGELQWCLVIVDAWRHCAGINTGPVFRSFWHGNRVIRPGRLPVRAVKDVMDSYPISIDGHVQTVHPHDLRRTYARRQYEAGMDIIAIRDNLGHSSVKTTERYIGEMQAHRRRAESVYTFDLSALPDTLPQLAAD